ncbi:M42 family metallopeptidase [Sedimentibacter sp. zth1]|uniref:M42 family metallopeptidase n=1 Tax=Sedimentibacter sp. zth1 TaxID=2816908 RepID=UPI001A91BB3F|nr:M42 family metallopeptidase [Sedimentibacter sp. zth1]QSX06783.1 M42 family metallopeptidase [Sedimentibacter sp. zth1]
MSKTKDFLFELCSSPFVSGSEYKNGQVLKKYFSEYTDNFEQDNLGSYIFKSTGSNGKKIMLAAHIDEIGLMVTDILDNGFLSFTTVGGINPASLIAQDVVVCGKENVRGVIGIKPPHITSAEEMKKASKISELYIDIGMSKDNAKKIVSIGDVATINRQAQLLENDMVTCKSLDNKSGVAVMYKVAKELSKIGHKSDVYYTATTQEEVGLRGARTSSYKINPDIAIIVDVGFGSTPELPSNTMKMGKGGGICLGANFNPKLNKKLIEVAKEYNYDYQLEIAPAGSGTDAIAIQVTQTGVPCLLISIPLRYMHTSVEVISMNDVKSIGSLIARFINEIDNSDLEEITCF